MTESMMRILADLSGADEITLHGRAEEQILPQMVVGPDCQPKQVDPENAWPVEEAVLQRAIIAFTATTPMPESVMAAPQIVAHALVDPRGLAGVITLRYADAASRRPWWISIFLKIYQNHVNLINDAECDNLTGFSTARPSRLASTTCCKCSGTRARARANSARSDAPCAPGSITGLRWST